MAKLTSKPMYRLSGMNTAARALLSCLTLKTGSNLRRTNSRSPKALPSDGASVFLETHPFPERS